jgi:predicted dehydrogenase
MAAGDGSPGVVVIGTSFGCFTHVRALRNAGFDVRAVVGRDPDKTAERARQFDVPRALTSADDALALPNVDAVTIATPPHTHAALALTAITAGKHVLCEKPFARDTAEARTMLEAAEAAGIVHLLGTEFRFDTGQALLARAVAGGAVGEPRLATFLLHMPLLSDPAAEVPAWWADENQGGGWLGAHGSQVIDQVRATLGEFEGVSASLPHVAEHPMTAEDAFVVQFRLRTGLVGIMQSTSGDWGPLVVITRVTGSTGTAWIDGLGADVWVADRDGTRQLPTLDDLPARPPDPPPADVARTDYERMIAHGLDVAPYTRLAERFRDRILGRPADAAPRPATFADGVADMAVLDAIRRSAAEQAWVSVLNEASAPARG